MQRNIYNINISNFIELIPLCLQKNIQNNFKSIQCNKKCAFI
jgi:hypothetical protein